MEVLVKPTNTLITVSATSTLLEALIENAIPISYSCLAGRCGTCRCKVLEGNIIGSSATEGRLAQHGHYVLACQSRVQSESIIEIPEPDEIILHPTKTLKATVSAYEPLSHDVRRLRLKTDKAFNYSPGQFANLTFWQKDGTRPYSMAGIDGDNELEFHIRVVADGRVTSKLDDTLKIGSVVKLNGPLGASYLRRKNTNPMLCIATGTGLAPILSIIRGALESGMPNKICLIFGARTEDELYYLEYLAQIASQYKNFQYQICILHGATHKHYFQGLVTEAVIHYFPNLRDWRVYLAGAPAMVEAALLICVRRGVNVEHVYADAFYPVNYD